jgi:hypothetical protein
MTLVRYYNAEPLQLTNVDPENGILRNVALMSIGEAAGHNCRVDLGSLQGLFQLSQGKSIKAFLNHSYNPAPTEVVGVFSGIYIDAESGVLRASQFKALEAFKTHNRQAYDTLFELAMTAPESFGVSVSIYQDLEEAADGGSAFIRPTSIESADFVSAPAANKALFSKETPLDVSEKPIHNEITPTLPVVEKPPHSRFMNVIQSIHSAFGKSPEHVARAIQYAVENPEAKPEDVVGEVQAKLDAEDQAALIAENEALKAKVAELEGKLGIAEPEAAKVEELSKKVQAQEAQIVELSKTQRRFGIRPLKLESATVPDSRPVCNQSEFAAKTVSEKMEFSRKGGRISE